MLNAVGAGRTNQKTRTRTAIIDACRELTRTGAVITMPEVARLALISEATAYRYFPDLTTLLNEALDGLWPSPAEALAPITRLDDPAERIAITSEIFLRRVLTYQGSIRTMISATIARPEIAATRPGLRIAWIEYALAPAEALLGEVERVTQLKRDLAIIVSPESLFTLIDLCRLTPDEAVRSTVRLATTITATAFHNRSQDQR